MVYITPPASYTACRGRTQIEWIQLKLVNTHLEVQPLKGIKHLCLLDETHKFLTVNDQAHEGQYVVSPQCLYPCDVLLD